MVEARGGMLVMGSTLKKGGNNVERLMGVVVNFCFNHPQPLFCCNCRPT